MNRSHVGVIARRPRARNGRLSSNNDRDLPLPSRSSADPTRPHPTRIPTTLRLLTSDHRVLDRPESTVNSLDRVL